MQSENSKPENEWLAKLRAMDAENELKRIRHEQKGVKGCTIGCVVIVILFIVGSIWSTSEQSKHGDLRASVSFTGAAFTVTNDSDFEWEEVDFSINHKWKCKKYGVAPGSSVTLSLGDFTLTDGSMFNPFATKVQTFAVELYRPFIDIVSKNY